ncbi:MAG: hypothetical protein JO026_03505 [Patescibacteria group bacterium]|nr:hypothetical protein [Patescibacteria group bacterium]
MINASLNQKILAVWKKHFGTRKDVLAPIFYDNFKQGGILFIGMNPSFNPQGMRKIIRGTQFEKISPDIFYAWHTAATSPDQVDALIRLGRLVHVEYAFFKRMHEIAKECKTHFQHIDLFVYRQTKQNEFLRLVRDKKRVLNELGQDQLTIFLEALKEICPAVIVVSNAGSCGIIRDYFKSKLTWDEKRGFHWLSLDGERMPIFFSSMLSGQRALDTGSYERLKWQIRNAYSRKSN